MKLYAQFVLIFAIIATAWATSSTWGVRNITDTTIISKNLFYPAVGKFAQTFFFDIPASHQNNNKVISAIYLLDQFRNNTGPTNYLVAGGPGWTYASIQMRTQPGCGLNVTYVVYGKL